jgi:hypothetical protein
MSLPLNELLGPYSLIMVVFLSLFLPFLALVLLHNKLKPGKLPHQVDAVQQVKNEAFRSLRRLSRSRSSSAIKEEARRKLLQFQSKLRFSESTTRRQMEDDLIRMLQEAARYGITVTPDETVLEAA